MPEIQPADPATRRRVMIAAAVIIAACVAGWFGLQRWLSGLRGQDPAQIQAALERALIVSSWAALVPAMVLAVVLWRYGTRVCRSDRFPAPGAKLIRDTPVVHGQAAQVRGTVLKALAAFLALLAAGTLVAAYRLLARLGAA